MDRNRDLLRRFEDQTLQMKEMNQELVDLRAQLSITHRGRRSLLHSWLNYVEQSKETENESAVSVFYYIFDWLDKNCLILCFEIDMYLACCEAYRIFLCALSNGICFLDAYTVLCAC